MTCLVVLLREALQVLGRGNLKRMSDASVDLKMLRELSIDTTQKPDEWK